MTRWWSQDYVCCECGRSWNAIIPYEEREAQAQCEECAGAGSPKMGAPRVLQVSLPDGTKRAGFADLREAANLEAASFDLPPEKRGEMKKEIRKLKEIKK